MDYKRCLYQALLVKPDTFRSLTPVGHRIHKHYGPDVLTLLSCMDEDTVRTVILDHDKQEVIFVPAGKNESLINILNTIDDHGGYEFSVGLVNQAGDAADRLSITQAIRAIHALPGQYL